MGTNNNYQEQHNPFLVKDSEGQDSVSVLHQFHKDVREFETQCMTVDDGCLMQDSLSKSDVQKDISFDAVAATLEEVMAVISE